MNEKTAIITGATKGLGRELSRVFAENGYDIIGLYRADASAAKNLDLEFREKKLSGNFIEQDISKPGDWLEFDEVLKNNADKRLTAIINASAAFVPKPLHLIDWQEVSALIEVNLKGTFMLLKRLLPLMTKAREGTVIGILSSTLDFSAPPPKGFSAYIAAKSALDGFLKAVAAEYADRGIRVFSVSPKFMETALTEKWSEHLKSLIQTTAGISLPADVAARIFKLAGDPQIAGRGENYLLDEEHGTRAARG
jgi:3-oxoacyl-[acyl-carrier protein] reductase